MGISAIDKLINIEQLSLSPSLSIKTGSKQTLNVKTDNINIINYAYMGTASPENPDLIAERGQELLQSGKQTKNSKDTGIELVLSPFIGIVKSPGLPGTRFHLEFAVINHQDKPQVIKGSYVRLNDGIVHFKKFFKVNSQGFREPDLERRFPIVVAANGTARIAIEFENLEQPLIREGDLPGNLIVLIGNTRIVKKDFIFEVNKAMVNTLNRLQQMAIQNKTPLVFDAMIKS